MLLMTQGVDPIPSPLSPSCCSSPLPIRARGAVARCGGAVWRRGVLSGGSAVQVVLTLISGLHQYKQWLNSKHELLAGSLCGLTCLFMNPSSVLFLPRTSSSFPPLVLILFHDDLFLFY